MIRYQGFGRVAAAAIVVGCVMLGAPAKAQDVPEAHVQAARSAITALGVTNGFDNILPSMSGRLKTQLIQVYPNLEDAITKTVDEQTLALAARRGDLEKEAALVYAKAFSQEELTKMAEFFTSETGKKLLKDQPIANRELGKAAEIWAAGVGRDLEKNANDALLKIVGAEMQTPAAAPAPEAPKP